MAVRPLPSGQLNKIVSLIEPVKSGRIGERTTTWEPRFKRPAAILPMTGREYLNAHATESEITHRILLRGDSETKRITSAWRVKYLERTFELVSKIDQEERGVVIELMCKEVP